MANTGMSGYPDVVTKPRKIWVFLGLFIATPFVLLSLYICLIVLNVFHAHEHCIKQTGLAFITYAADHDGKLPSDTNGFGNALLLLVRGGYLGDTNSEHCIRLITGPGDDGALFRDALQTGARIPEEKCSRVYIQGLSEKNNPQIVILFDKKPCRGGDHFRRPFGPLVREVCLLDGAMEVIPEKNWPRFASNQVELLVQDGFDKATAKRLLQIP